MQDAVTVHRHKIAFCQCALSLCSLCGFGSTQLVPRAPGGQGYHTPTCHHYMPTATPNSGGRWRGFPGGPPGATRPHWASSWGRGLSFQALNRQPLKQLASQPTTHHTCCRHRPQQAAHNVTSVSFISDFPCSCSVAVQRAAALAPPPLKSFPATSLI